MHRERRLDITHMYQIRGSAGPGALVLPIHRRIISTYISDDIV